MQNNYVFILYACLAIGKDGLGVGGVEKHRL